MALPLLFVIGGALFRAATPTIAKYLGKQGLKQITKNSVKSSIKKYGSPKTISSIPKAAKIRTSTVKIKPQLSNAKEAAKKIIDKRLPNNKSLSVIKPKPKSKLINGKVITAATTVASVPALIAKKDDKKGEAKANTKKGKVDAGLQEALKKKARDAKNKKMNDIEKSTRGQKSKSTTTTTTTKTKGSGKVKATAANTKDFAKTMAMQKELIDKGANIKADGIMGPKTRAAMQKFMKPKTEKKVEKKVDKKVSNYVGSRAIPKKTEKEVEKKKSKSFLGRVKEDFDKAVKETKRNFSDKRYFVNGVDSRKEKIKSKSNIKKKK